jgi:hypothetical protein
MRYKVYGLYSERDNILRYVGITVGELIHRLSGHKSSARKGSRSRCHEWIREQNYRVYIKELACCDDRKECYELEQKLIYGTENLLNTIGIRCREPNKPLTRIPVSSDYQRWLEDNSKKFK